MCRKKAFSLQERKEIYDMYDGHCAYCGYKIRYDEMVIDHILPISKGGSNKIENLFPSCGDCNAYKYNLTLGEFRVKVNMIYDDNDFKYRMIEKYRDIIPKHERTFYFERGDNNG